MTRLTPDVSLLHVGLRFCGVADEVTRLTLFPETADSHQRLSDPPTAPDLSLLHVGYVPSVDDQQLLDGF